MMRKILVRTLTLLGALVLLLGAVGYWQSLKVEWWSRSNSRLYGVNGGFAEGTVWLCWYRSSDIAPGSRDLEKEMLGFCYLWSYSYERLTYQCSNGSKRTVNDARATSLQAPFWLLGTVLLLYPAWALTARTFRRLYRRKTGRCLGCGYDLTGNVSGVCPECGTPVPDARTPKTPS
jgi:hypothetical protein